MRGSNSVHFPAGNAARATRPGNKRHLILRTPQLRRALAAVAAGVMLSSAFSPLEWWWWATFGLVPVMCLASRPNRRPAWLGYAFGFGHFTTTFAWLREVFFPIPALIAMVHACLPALWLWLTVSTLRRLEYPRGAEVLPHHDPDVRIQSRLGPGSQCVFVVITAAAWVAVEWCRSWMFSGFPWNQLGVSLWQNDLFLPVCRWTGVYGLSFVLVAINAVIFLRLYRPDPRFGTSYRSRWHPSFVVMSLLAVVVVAHVTQPVYPQPDGHVQIAAIQGNLPQARIWSQDQLDTALDVYTSLTRQAVAAAHPELVLWPETAIPASLLYNEQCRLALASLFNDIATPILAGSIHFRLPPQTQPQDRHRTVNSAILFTADGRVQESYDKMHLVPFGEYVPFAHLWPWLVDWIGMGRGLTAGTEYTTFVIGEYARVGVNICYEDVFPEISAGHVRRGANVLVTITNDAWFGETSGSRQHLAHSVLRAVETGRPMLRNGNNSDTCLILPNGEIRGRLVGHDGTPFARAFGHYSVPVWLSMPLTFYSRWGNWFAVIAVVVTVVTIAWCVSRWLLYKRRLFETVTGAP